MVALPETEKITSPESVEHDLARQFSFAERELAHCASEVDEFFLAEGKDLDDIPIPRYWMRVAEHVNHFVNQEYSQPYNLEYGKLLQMTALIPIGYLASKQAAAIDRIPKEQRTVTDNERRQTTVAVACRYSNSITDYARSNESLTTSLLSDHIVHILSKTLGFQEDATRPLTSYRVTGVQHEVAAGYVLFNALEARVATVEEDLQGADYVAFHRGNYGAMIDIKTSPGTIVAAGGEPGKNWVVSNGRILTTSLITTEELGGKFQPSAKLIRERSPVMQRMMAEAMTDPTLALCTYEGGTWKQ